jgi:N-methylhydantoinase A
MSDIDAAWGILTVLVTNCVTAMRTITVERGYDPRDFVLVSFGGMGPTITGMIAAELGIKTILVPPNPGAFSAWGMLVTDVHQERSLTRVTALNDSTPDDIEAIFQEMEDNAIKDLALENFTSADVKTIRVAGMRYRGQSYEVNVDVPKLRDQEDFEILAQRFHEAHERRYGHKATSEIVEIVNYKVTGVGIIPKVNVMPCPAFTTSLPKPLYMRDAFFGSKGMQKTPIYDRKELTTGMKIKGPAIVQEKTSTIVIYPQQSAEIDELMNMIITIKAAD